jgi:hypothetical protein
MPAAGNSAVFDLRNAARGCSASGDAMMRWVRRFGVRRRRMVDFSLMISRNLNQYQRESYLDAGFPSAGAKNAREICSRIAAASP